MHLFVLYTHRYVFLLAIVQQATAFLQFLNGCKANKFNTIAIVEFVNYNYIIK